jgi:hypothetical protein
VKNLGYALLVILIVSCTSRAQTRPRPPGLQQADQAETQAQQNIPPPSTVPQRKRIDMVNLQSEANDLARLAQSIPADISSIQQGQLPKDLFEKLKQVEKISKHMRAEIMQ